MRVLTFIVLIVALTGCQGTQVYTQQDYRQVTTAVRELVPAYLAFERAYLHNDTPQILHTMQIEHRVCFTLVDQVDSRDTIDPNVNLFHVSASLDNVCNSMEQIYVTWAKKHGYPYNKHLIPARPVETFLAQNKELPIMAKQLQKPTALT